MTDTKLTPTQDLILDVLAGRYRLGDTLWTFDSRLSPAIDGLSDLGLVQPMHGTVHKTVRASLTEAGIAASMINDFTPTVFSKRWTKERRRMPGPRPCARTSRGHTRRGSPPPCNASQPHRTVMSITDWQAAQELAVDYFDPDILILGSLSRSRGDVHLKPNPLKA